MNFELNRDNSIVVYGASLMAISWLEKAVLKGFTIKVFIDKSAEKIKCVRNVPVITLETYCRNADKDDIVIIMLQNVMWHEDIVKNLAKIGVRKVIFFPMTSRKIANKEDLSSLRIKYHECIKFLFDDSIKDIPILNYFESYDGNEGMIWEERDECVVWAPIELCYSIEGIDACDIWKSDYTQEAIQLCEKYLYNKNLFNVYPYWELFSYLKGEMNDCSLYLKIFGREGHIHHEKYDDDVLLKDRNELIEIFKEEACKGNTFFEESPADSGVGKLGRVVIYDGLHRSIFLIDRGYCWIPIRMDGKSYKYLYNGEAVQRVKDYLREKHIVELEYPLESFGFYDFPVRHQHLRMIWKEITNEIASRGWILSKVIDCTLTDGYFSRAFYREGIKQIACFSDKENKLLLLINSIFRIDNIKVICSICDLRKNIAECEFVILNMKYLRIGEIWNQFLSVPSLKAVCVYDILVNEAEEILSDIFYGRKVCLLKRYALDGKINGIYMIY